MCVFWGDGEGAIGGKFVCVCVSGCVDVFAQVKWEWMAAVRVRV